MGNGVEPLPPPGSLLFFKPSLTFVTDDNGMCVLYNRNSFCKFSPADSNDKICQAAK